MAVLSNTMARSPWKAIVQAQPADGAQVWIRLEPFGYAIPAYWHSASQDLTSLAGHVIVTGCTQEADNGTFYRCATYNGAPVYLRADRGAIIWWSDATACWNLGSDVNLQDQNPDYQSQSPDVLGGTWHNFAGGSDVPVVAVALAFSAASNIYWKPYP